MCIRDRPGVVKLSFINKFLSDQWLQYFSINISTHSWCEREDLYVVYYMLGLGFLWCFLQPIKEEWILEQLSSCHCKYAMFIRSRRLLLKSFGEQMTSFFSLTKVLFGLIFFPKLCLKLGVRLIHKCCLYMSLYSIYQDDRYSSSCHLL